jgi:hypothetical protein
MKLSAPLETPIYLINVKYSPRKIRSREESIPVRLTITASGLFWQILRAHFRAVDINSSCGTMALTTPHSCIFCGEIGSPINAISEARCNPVSSTLNQTSLPRNLIILPRAPALANTPRFTSGRAKDALLLAITISLLLDFSWCTPTNSLPSQTLPLDINTTSMENTKCEPIDSSDNGFKPLPSRNPTKPLNQIDSRRRKSLFLPTPSTHVTAGGKTIQAIPLNRRRPKRPANPWLR